MVELKKSEFYVVGIYDNVLKSLVPETIRVVDNLETAKRSFVQFGASMVEQPGNYLEDLDMVLFGCLDTHNQNYVKLDLGTIITGKEVINICLMQKLDRLSKGVVEDEVCN